MGTRAKAGTELEALVRMAVPLLRQAETNCPRRGRGDKPDIPDWVMAALIMIVLLKRKKSKSAQYRFLFEQRAVISRWLNNDQFPSRSTYFRRYLRAHHLYQEAIRLQGECAVAEGIANPENVAIDKSLIEALGPAWHKQDRQAGRIPAGVDTDSTWGYSEHDQWVQGYSYEVVVTATPRTVVFPLLASVDVASAGETRSGVKKIKDLHHRVRTIAADSGYDSNELGEMIEYDEYDRRTGRHFLCPENPRNNKRPKTKPCNADASRARSRQRRQQRRKFLGGRQGRRLYRRRKKTVEPFNQWFKSMFELDQRVWHRGLGNNRTQILTAIFIYQLLVRCNHRRGNKNGRVRWIMDAL
jgi:hypothetical protein